MAHDGQAVDNATPVLLDDLLALTGTAIAPVETILETARAKLRTKLSVNDRVSAALVEQHQTAAHCLLYTSPSPRD